MTNPAKLRTALRSTTAIAAALLFAAAPAAAQNLPDTGNVTTTTGGLSGGAPGSTTPTFSTSGAPGAQTLRVDLKDNRTILTWGGSGFSIAAGNTVDFKDSRATSGVTGRTDNIAVLNRDLSGGPSNISGALRSDPNVAVYVVNRNGMFFGETASIDTGALFAGAGDFTSQSDFLSGSPTLRLNGAVQGASVFANPGSKFRTTASASTDGGRMGDIVIIGSSVQFKGWAGTTPATATAGGDMALIAASDVTIQSSPGSPLSFTINQGAMTNNQVVIDVGGTITARNITIASARGPNTGDPRVEITGQLTATGASISDRGIVLTAGGTAPGVAFAGTPVEGNPSAPIRKGGSMLQAGVVVSAKDIWINAVDGTVGDGSLQAQGHLDIAGAEFFAGGIYNDISTRATITAGSIALHAQGYFKGKVKTTSGDFTVDSAAGYPFATTFLDTLEVAGNFTGNAYSLMAWQNVTVGGDVNLTTTRDQQWVGTIQAGSFRAVSLNTLIFIQGLTTRTGDIYLRAPDTVVLPSGISAGGVDLGAGRGLFLGNITASGNIVLTSGEFGYGTLNATGANSDITIKVSLFKESTNSTMTAGRDVDIQTFSGNLGSITAGRNVALRGSIGATLVKATTGSVTVGSPGSLDTSAGIGTLYAGTFATLYGESLSIENATVGTDLTLTTPTVPNDDRTVTIRNAQVGGNLRVNAPGTVNLTGDITVGGNIWAVGGTRVRLGRGTFDVSSIKANGEIYLSAGMWGILSDGEVTVQSNADGVGAENLRFETAGGINLASVSTLVGGTASQRTNIEIRTATNNSVRLGAVTARSFTSAIGNGALTSGLTVGAILEFYRDVTLTDSTSITAQTINAGTIGVTNGDLSLNATSSNLILTSASASGNLSLTSGNGNLTFTSASAGGNLSLTSTNGSITLMSATATTGNLTLSATGGSILLGNQTTGAGGATAGGDISFTATGNLTIRSNVTAGGNLTGSGGIISISNSTSTLLTVKAAGALTLTSTSGTVTTPTTPVVIQSNSDGVGSEALTLNAATTVNFNPSTTLLGGTARQSDVQIRNPNNSFVNVGWISARSLLGATGTDSFTNGITRNAQVILRQVNLINSFYASGTSVTINNVTVSNGNIDVRSGAALTLPGALNASGDIDVRTSNGNITIGAAGSATGTDVILSTPAAFINTAGANAVIANGGHWVIYSANPANNTFGGLNSGNTALWDSTLATRAPDSVTGNRYVFSIKPTLTISAANYTKTYGDDLTFPAGQAQLSTVTGYNPGVAGAFLGDTAGSALSGALDISSPGLAMRASVAGGPYAITLSPGTLTSPTGYAIAFSNNSATITVTPKALAISYITNNKFYDGTTAGTGSVQIGGIIAGDTVTATGTTWTFDGKNAANGRTVTIAGTSIGGADIGNYSFTLPSGTVLADILKARLNPSVTANNKTYDGTVAATGFVALLGVVGNEDVQLTGGTLEFLNKNAGPSRGVTLVGNYSLTGADIANYELGSVSIGHAVIFQKAIGGTVTANSRTYDGTTAGTGSVTLNGVIGGDSVGTAGTVFTFDNRNAGTGKTVTVSGTALSGADAGNYTLSGLPATVLADIFKKALTGTVTANSRTYDGTTGATGTVTLNGVVGNDTVGTAGTVFTFDNRNAGTGKTVTVSGTALSGADAGNYTLSGLPATVLADIFKKALTGTVTANSRTYDGTTGATGTVTLNGVVGNDTVGTTGTVFTFDNRNAGTGKTVTVSGTSLSGADAGNYTLSGLPATVLADIFKKALTGTVTANSRTYDGTTGATGSVTLNGVVGNDAVGTTGSVFSFADKNAGTGKTVTVTGTALSGADAGNYTLSVGTGLADIFKKALTGTVTANSRTYDGTTGATGSVTLGGVIGNDAVGTTGSVFNFADKNAGTGKTVTVTGTTLTGTDAGNYTLSVGTGLADVFKKALTGVATVNGKTYDGTTSGTGTVALNGVVGGDTVGTTGTVFTFDNRNAGTGKTVTVSGTALSGTDAGNYTLAPLATALGDIFKKALTLSVAVDSRTYNGGTAATGTVTLNGVVGNEDVGTAGAALAFADKNAGTGKAVTVTGATLTGADSGNYTLTLPTGVVGDILKLGINGTVTVNNKTYDGNTAGTGTVTLSGVLQGDTVGTAGTAFTFDNKNAGTHKTVTITAALSGADAGNYTLTLPASAFADILRRSINGTVTITARPYDGTTAATGTVTLNGVVAGDNVGTTGTVLTYADRNAGTGKTVSVGGTTLNGTDAGNYTLSMPASALGDILRRSVSVSADNKDKYRDDSDPLLTFTITSGSLVSGDAFAGGLVRAPGDAPGSYAITIGSLSLGNNYTITFSPGVLTILLDPAQNQQQVLKAIPLPSQTAVPSAPGTEVTIDKDALCEDDAACVAQ